MGMHTCGEEYYQYSNNQFEFAFEFIRSKDTINDITKDGERALTDDKKAAFALFKRTPHATKSDFAIELGKSESTANCLVKHIICSNRRESHMCTVSCIFRYRSAKVCRSKQGMEWIVMFG